jgi:hypothetical protein
MLVLIPNSGRVLLGAEPIRAEYPRPYRPEQMRAWAHDLDRFYELSRADRIALLSAERERLPPNAARVRAVYDNYFLEPDRGVKGDLGPDGRVELAGGRHRAAYMVEQGTSPIPVWVSCQDSAQLARFRDTCHARVDPRVLEIVDDRVECRREVPESSPSARRSTTGNRGVREPAFRVRKPRADRLDQTAERAADRLAPSPERDR